MSHKNLFPDDTSIHYPRRRITRSLVRFVCRGLLPLLTDICLDGIENIPQKGPVILAGNHVAVMEVVLMVVYSPRIVELIGAGDIPIDPKFAWIANLYGFIPIKRGTIDRNAIKLAQSILEQGGTLGVFPEGGIWEPELGQMRQGVALLSVSGDAPIVPIGFSGMAGALTAMAKFKRPRLVVKIGAPISPTTNNYRNKKLLTDLSKKVREEINSLLEPSQTSSHSKSQENFSIRIELLDCSIPTKKDLNLCETDKFILGKFFHFPILLDAMKRNLGLPVGSLQNLGQPVSMTDIVNACRAISDYVNKINPGFFTYRFGIDEGIKMLEAINRLEIKLNGFNESQILITPLYSYYDGDTAEYIYLEGPTSLQEF